jgi:hypothetical protein
MPSYPFLSHHLPLYDQHLSGWHRDERRLAGGDAILEELRQWKGEADADFLVRQGTAGYMPLPKNHVLTLTGHLSSQTSMPNFAEMGKVRERKDLRGTPSLAELLNYNVDGGGQDGKELLPYTDEVNERAMATGYRWTLVEMPTLQRLAEIRAARLGIPREDTQAVMRAAGDVQNNPVTMQDVVDGFRAYPVEWSPILVPYWHPITGGPLDFAVAKVPIESEALVDEDGNVVGDVDGFYLLVRRGYRGLGDQWAQGGWWKIDSDHTIVSEGRWDSTLGRIPLFRFYGEGASGTTAKPAVARSLTMELGQIAVGLMILRSARDYNLIEAAKSTNHVLGIDPDSHGKVITQQEAGSITVGYPPVMTQAGTIAIPQIWNSSAALVDAGAFDLVIRASLEEAREIMVKQVTSTPDSSGRSKEAGFAEATSPLLARLAATRQQWINTFLYFWALRAGIPNPTASVQIPREFDLQPVVDDIDAMLSRLKRSWLRSPTWEKHLLLRAGDEEGMLPEDKAERDAIEAELEASATPTEPEDVLEGDQGETPGRRGPKPQGGFGEEAA